MRLQTNCKPVKMTKESGHQKMCDLLKHALKKTHTSVMPPSVLAALLTCYCAKGIVRKEMATVRINAVF